MHASRSSRLHAVDSSNGSWYDVHARSCAIRPLAAMVDNLQMALVRDKPSISA